MKRILAVILICLFLSTKDIQANNQDIFSLDNSSLSDVNLKQYISSLVIKHESDRYSLYVNNKFIGDSELISNDLSYQFVLEGVSYIITFDVAQMSLAIKYAPLLANVIDSWVILETIEGVHTIKVYPYLLDKDNYYTSEGNMTEQGYVFNDIEVVYDEKMKLNFAFELDSVTSVLKIKVNNDVYYVNCSQQEQSQTIFLETHVEEHLLDSQYLAILPHVSFQKAQSIVYSSSEVNSALGQEVITLINSKTGLTYQTSLVEFVNYWERIGQEEYITDYDQKLQVACQYQDELCQIYQHQDRVYAIFGQDYHYQKPIEYNQSLQYWDYDNLVVSNWMSFEDLNDSLQEQLETEEQSFKNYVYYSDWSDYQYSYDSITSSSTIESEKQYRYQSGGYSEYSNYVYDEERKTQCDDQEYCKWKKATVYSTSTATWSNYSKYVDELPSENCDDNEDCKYVSKPYYSINTGTWGNYGKYAYTANSSVYTDCLDNSDCAVNSKTMYSKVTGSLTGTYSSWTNSCSNSLSARCQPYYKYTCKYLIFTKTAYSNNQYITGKQGPCDKNYTISTVSNGYRQAYLTYPTSSSEDYTLTSCTPTLGYTKCLSSKLYAVKHRTWSGYSGYNYTSCTDSSNNTTGVTYKCKSKTKYAYSYLTWSDYSPYSLVSCQASPTTRCKTDTKYAISQFTYSDYSDWSSYSPGNDVYNLQVRYKYRTRNVLSRGFALEVPINAQYVNDETYYRYKTPSKVTEIETRIKLGDAVLGIREEYTINDILLLANDLIEYKAYSDLLADYPNGLKKEEFVELISDLNLAPYQKVKKEFLETAMFTPYIYVTDHYRAKKVPLLVNTFSAAKSISISNGDLSYQQDIGKMLLQENNDISDTRVVYFDPNKPFDKYPVTPSNWVGYENVVNEIENASQAKSKVKIVLTESSIKKIREYYLYSNERDNLIEQFPNVFVKFEIEPTKEEDGISN